MKRYHVNVKQNHLDDGIPQEECACPVALAVYEAGIPVGSGVSSFSLWNFPASTSSWTEDGSAWPEVGKWQHVPFPEEVRDAIYRIDHGETVEPFEFDIELPDDWTVLGEQA